MESLFTTLGGIGAIAFAIVSLPLVYNAFKEKSSKAISIGYLVLSYIGNIFSFSYVLYTNISNGVYQVPLYFNYSFALMFVIVLTILKFKYKY
ncbi:MAG: PQ-loop domain-containing transporter [Paludibacteraceae bacterium]|nr:PQ-loop domain-containing transporter [Paludibacteraceae bacterium]